MLRIIFIIAFLSVAESSIDSINLCYLLNCKAPTTCAVKEIRCEQEHCPKMVFCAKDLVERTLGISDCEMVRCSKGYTCVTSLEHCILGMCTLASCVPVEEVEGVKRRHEIVHHHDHDIQEENSLMPEKSSFMPRKPSFELDYYTSVPLSKKSWRKNGLPGSHPHIVEYSVDYFGDRFIVPLDTLENKTVDLRRIRSSTDYLNLLRQLSQAHAKVLQKKKKVHGFAEELTRECTANNCDVRHNLQPPQRTNFHEKIILDNQVVGSHSMSLVTVLYNTSDTVNDSKVEKSKTCCVHCCPDCKNTTQTPPVASLADSLCDRVNSSHCCHFEKSHMKCHHDNAVNTNQIPDEQNDALIPTGHSDSEKVNADSKSVESTQGSYCHEKGLKCCSAMDLTSASTDDLQLLKMNQEVPVSLGMGGDITEAPKVPVSLGMGGDISEAPKVPVSLGMGGDISEAPKVPVSLGIGGNITEAPNILVSLGMGGDINEAPKVIVSLGKGGDITEAPNVPVSLGIGGDITESPKVLESLKIGGEITEAPKVLVSLGIGGEITEAPKIPLSLGIGGDITESPKVLKSLHIVGDITETPNVPVSLAIGGGITESLKVPLSLGIGGDITEAPKVLESLKIGGEVAEAPKVLVSLGMGGEITEAPKVLVSLGIDGDITEAPEIPVSLGIDGDITEAPEVLEHESELKMETVHQAVKIEKLNTSETGQYSQNGSVVDQKISTEPHKDLMMKGHGKKYQKSGIQSKNSPDSRGKNLAELCNGSLNSTCVSVSNKVVTNRTDLEENVNETNPSMLEAVFSAGPFLHKKLKQLLPGNLSLADNSTSHLKTNKSLTELTGVSPVNSQYSHDAFLRKDNLTSGEDDWEENDAALTPHELKTTDCPDCSNKTGNDTKSSRKRESPCGLKSDTAEISEFPPHSQFKKFPEITGMIKKQLKKSSSTLSKKVLPRKFQHLERSGGMGWRHNFKYRYD